MIGKISVFVLVLLTSSLCATAATLGYDIDTTSVIFNDIRGQFVSIRCWLPNGQPDENVYWSSRQARAAGAAFIDVYMSPCTSCGNPSGQVKGAMAFLQKYNIAIQRNWIQVRDPLSWGTNQSANAVLISGMLNATQALGIPVGVFTSAEDWEAIVGTEFAGASSVQLWYSSLDNDPSFADFKPFGGWTKPYRKQYGVQEQFNTDYQE